MLRSTLNRILHRVGFRMEPLLTTGIASEDAAILRASLPYTMTSPERILAVIDAVRYIVRAGIPGALVECGVWRGGSMMAAAQTLLQAGAHDRTLFLFDTFQGMPEPAAMDVDYSGRPASREYMARRTASSGSTWCAASKEEVRANLDQIGYAAEKIKLIEGCVEETLPDQAPQTIALLRLDTDWYESTRLELVHLYPRLSPGGVLIVDDYGHWRGARSAVDEYFSAAGCAPLLTRVDYSCRIGVKPSAGVV